MKTRQIQPNLYLNNNWLSSLYAILIIMDTKIWLDSMSLYTQTLQILCRENGPVEPPDAHKNGRYFSRQDLQQHTHPTTQSCITLRLCRERR